MRRQRLMSVTILSLLRRHQQPVASGKFENLAVALIFPTVSSQAVEGGATVLFGDADTKRKPSSKPGAGYYVSPTILSEVSDENEAWTSEIFGPVRFFCCC